MRMAIRPFARGHVHRPHGGIVVAVPEVDGRRGFQKRLEICQQQWLMLVHDDRGGAG